MACDRQASPRITGCVFVNNRAGLDDTMRSSDGGALSIFGGSRPEVVGNVVTANRALTQNDSGGIFVALWSSPRIVGNVIVGNYGDDDAGGLFIGGQEHRYDRPLDTYPPAEKFNVIVERNVFVGNSHHSTNSGAMRITMESRVRLAHNVIAANEGGVSIERSEVTAERNTIWQDWRFLKGKMTPGPSRFFGNVLREPAGPIEGNVILSNNMIEAKVPGVFNVPLADIFENDGVRGDITQISYDPTTMTTHIVTGQPLPAADYEGRPVCLGEKWDKGQWRVIKEASDNSMVLWGQLSRAVTHLPKHFEILRTFHLRPDSPAGLGAVPSNP
jgi:hypothetical protein